MQIGLGSRSHLVDTPVIGVGVLLAVLTNLAVQHDLQRFVGLCRGELGGVPAI